MRTASCLSAAQQPPAVSGDGGQHWRDCGVSQGSFCSTTKRTASHRLPESTLTQHLILSTSQTTSFQKLITTQKERSKNSKMQKGIMPITITERVSPLANTKTTHFYMLDFDKGRACPTRTLLTLLKVSSILRPR